jgi:membrane associated rhomboid family serine protease
VDEPQSIWVEVARDVDPRRSREHALVLQALDVPHGAIGSQGAQILVVPGEHAERARAEIGRYDRENASWPPREETPLPVSDGIQAAIVYAAVLALFFLLENRTSFGLDWWHSGAASTSAIRGGEWWRALTALSLHTDLSHVGGNILFGSVFGVILAQSLGSGVAWSGFIVAGTVGNLLNALLQKDTHVSVGASTGVFGALGIQVAYEWMRRRELRYSRLRRWAPLAMGIALFFWLGTGGGHFSETNTARETQRQVAEVLERVDVMAHVTGFATGMALGVGLGLLRSRMRLRGWWQAGLAWGALATLGLGWLLALTRG